MTKDEKEKLYRMDVMESIAVLGALPPEDLDYDLVGILARAYNNTYQEQKAKNLLLTVKVEGESDGVWNYRMGYSCLRLGEYRDALAYLKRAEELGCVEWANELLPQCIDLLNPVPFSREEYVIMMKYDTTVSICFYIEHNKPLSIGEKMNEINTEAYMNGYNWEAFFNFYLAKFTPQLLEGMDTDPEAGMYVAYYDLTPENEKKAEKFYTLIKYLIENEEEIYRILREYGNHIEWD